MVYALCPTVHVTAQWPLSCCETVLVSVMRQYAMLSFLDRITVRYGPNCFLSLFFYHTIQNHTKYGQPYFASLQGKTRSCIQFPVRTAQLLFHPSFFVLFLVIMPHSSYKYACAIEVSALLSF